MTEAELSNMGKPAKISGPKESEIQRNIAYFMRLHGWFVVKIHQSLGCHKGIADLYALRAVEHIWIQVKTPVGKLSDDQIAFKNDIESHGGVYLVARSIDDVMHL